jgi:hypothetical protein
MTSADGCDLTLRLDVASNALAYFADRAVWHAAVDRGAVPVRAIARIAVTGDMQQSVEISAFRVPGKAKNADRS